MPAWVSLDLDYGVNAKYHDQYCGDDDVDKEMNF